jgi:hypothetical protein
MVIAPWTFRRPFRTNPFARQIQTLRVWLISFVAPRHSQRNHKVIIPLIVQEILDEHIVEKLA